MNLQNTGGPDGVIRFFTGVSLDFCLVLVVPFLFILALYCVCWSLGHALRAVSVASPGNRRLFFGLCGLTVSGTLFLCEQYGIVHSPFWGSALVVAAGVYYAAALAGGGRGGGSAPPS